MVLYRSVDLTPGPKLNTGNPINPVLAISLSLQEILKVASLDSLIHCLLFSHLLPLFLFSFSLDKDFRFHHLLFFKHFLFLRSCNQIFWFI